MAFLWKKYEGKKNDIERQEASCLFCFALLCFVLFCFVCVSVSLLLVCGACLIFSLFLLPFLILSPWFPRFHQMFSMLNFPDGHRSTVAFSNDAQLVLQVLHQLPGLDNEVVGKALGSCRRETLGSGERGDVFLGFCSMLQLMFLAFF